MENDFWRYEGENVHDVVDSIYCHALVYLFHGGCCVLHGV